MTNEERLSEVHKRINSVASGVSKLYGGVAVLAFLALTVGAMVAYHINFRFSNIEKSLEKIERKVSSHKCQTPIKITSVSP